MTDRKSNKFHREIARLRRIEGQARGIIRMMEEDRYCIDILQQLAAMEAALRAARMRVLNIHARTCINDAIVTGNTDEQAEKVSELIALIEKMGR
ncbi:MAG: transcriptional regulator [Sphingomonadales bacterium BRH_c42]|nr:MAG: transcriptional regulator [Sphingomonadales bacterium BRH_c42]